MALIDTALKSLTAAAKSKAAKDAGKKVAGAAGSWVAANGSAKGFEAWQGRRRTRNDRELAIALAQQVGGTFSEGTVIAGGRYYVVWREDEPIEVFPPLPEGMELASRPELSGFRGRRLDPTELPERSVRRLGRRRSSST